MFYAPGTADGFPSAPSSMALNAFTSLLLLLEIKAPLGVLHTRTWGAPTSARASLGREGGSFKGNSTGIFGIPSAGSCMWP